MIRYHKLDTPPSEKPHNCVVLSEKTKFVKIINNILNTNHNNLMA